MVVTHAATLIFSRRNIKCSDGPGDGPFVMMVLVTVESLRLATSHLPFAQRAIAKNDFYNIPRASTSN